MNTTDQNIQPSETIELTSRSEEVQLNTDQLSAARFKTNGGQTAT